MNRPREHEACPRRMKCSGAAQTPLSKTVESGGKLFLKKPKKGVDKPGVLCYNTEVARLIDTQALSLNDTKRKFSSAGRASALQAEGHRFEPYNFHHYGQVVQLVRTLACHARGRGFEPHPGRQFGIPLLYASVAQLVEQRTENPRVVGSIPTGGTSGIDRYADLAHLVERDLAKVEVAGSSPVIRSRSDTKTFVSDFYHGAIAKR